MLENKYKGDSEIRPIEFTLESGDESLRTAGAKRELDYNDYDLMRKSA